jgi:hypothetical protein
MVAESLFTKEEIKNIYDLGNVLRGIRARLKREGISIEDARKEIYSKKNYAIIKNKK